MLEMKESDGFTDDHREAILGLLRTIQDDKEVRTRSDFPALLEKTIDPFHSAGLGSYVDRIVEMFPDECQRTQGIVFTLVSHYGQRLVAQPQSPEHWSADLLERFETFEARAKDFHIPGNALAFRILFEHRRAGLARAPHVAELIERAQGIGTPSDVARMLFYVLQYTDWRTYMSRATPEALKLQDVATSLMSTYRRELRGLRTEPVISALVEDASRFPEGSAIIERVATFVGSTGD
jgi:hypothetical protein